jgi:hypothetical protein
VASERFQGRGSAISLGADERGVRAAQRGQRNGAASCDRKTGVVNEGNGVRRRLHKGACAIALVDALDDAAHVALRRIELNVEILVRQGDDTSGFCVDDHGGALRLISGDDQHSQSNGAGRRLGGKGRVHIQLVTEPTIIGIHFTEKRHGYFLIGYRDFFPLSVDTWFSTSAATKQFFMEGPRVYPPSLYVGDVADGTSEEQIQNCFDANTRETIYNVVFMKKNLGKNILVPHAFVNFYTIMDAEAALERYSRLVVGNAIATVGWSRHDAPKIIYVENIPPLVSKQALLTLFSDIASVQTMKYDTRGRASLLLSTVEDAQLCVRQKHGMIVSGQPITVCYYPHNPGSKHGVPLSTTLRRLPAPAPATPLPPALPAALPPAPAPSRLPPAAARPLPVPSLVKQAAPPPVINGGAAAALITESDQSKKKKKQCNGITGCDSGCFLHSLNVGAMKLRFKIGFDVTETCEELMKQDAGTRTELLVIMEQIGLHNYEVYTAQLTKLKELVEKEVEARARIVPNMDCVVCMDRTRNCMLPCKHMILCDRCAERLKTERSVCPICSASFSTYTVVYL